LEFLIKKASLDFYGNDVPTLNTFSPEELKKLKVKKLK